MSSSRFWTASSRLHSFLWGIDQWVALQVGSQLECLQIRCTFDELDVSPVADRMVCLRRGANHSTVRLFHQQTALGVMDIQFRQPLPSTEGSTTYQEPVPAKAPPFSGIGEAFSHAFPHVATRLIHPQPSDLLQIGQAVADQRGVPGQLEITSAWSNQQNADVRIAATQLCASVWTVASDQRWAA